MSICVRTPKWLDRQHSKTSTIPKLPHRKSCLMLPPYCVQASHRMLKKKKTWCVTHTWKCLHLKRHMPSLTCFQRLRRRSIRYPAPTLLFRGDDSSFPEVANVHPMTRSSAVNPCRIIQNRLEVTREEKSRPSNSVPKAFPLPKCSSVLLRASPGGSKISLQSETIF